MTSAEWTAGAREIPARHMMATRALHLLGDLSSTEPDICVVDRETDEYWIGSWVFGFGFIDVKFPKETTRPLTDEEVAHHHGRRMAINNTPIGPLEIKR